MSIADVSFSIHSSASATVKRLMHFLQTKVTNSKVKLNISSFLRTCTIALGNSVVNNSHLFVRVHVPTNRNTHVSVSKFPDFSWSLGAMDFCRDPGV